jgi:hypothetical protein
LWAPAGLFLLGVHAALLPLSFRFASGSTAEKPILVLVALEIAAGAVIILLLPALRRTRPGRGLLLWAFLVGLVLRALMMASTPMLENDYCRYLWDGAVAARGYNPYAHAPQDVLAGEEGVPESLTELARSSRGVAHQVNHSHLRTVYPPVAQAAFAAAHVLAPFRLEGLRAILLLFDAAVLLLLVHGLRSLGLSALWSVLYWWNPLVMKEVFNSGHMDVMIVPFLLGAVLFANRRRFVTASFLLALATGVKLWPVILLPLLLRPAASKPKVLVPALALFGAVCALLAVPVVRGGFGPGSGFTAYGGRWEMNDALFMLILWGTKVFSTEHAALTARGVALVLLGAWVVKLARPKPSGPPDLWNRCLLATAALFLLSPAQFPWYFLWVLPFLVLRPRFSLLLFTALLPLYYLRFHLKARGAAAWFDHGVVWIEFVPVWILLAWEGWRSQVDSAAQDAAGEEAPAAL